MGEGPGLREFLAPYRQQSLERITTHMQDHGIREQLRDQAHRAEIERLLVGEDIASRRGGGLGEISGRPLGEHRLIRRPTLIRERHEIAQHPLHRAALAAGVHARMGAEHGFDQRRAGARHADDEHRSARHRRRHRRRRQGDDRPAAREQHLQALGALRLSAAIEAATLRGVACKREVVGLRVGLERERNIRRGTLGLGAVHRARIQNVCDREGCRDPVVERRRRP